MIATNLTIDMWRKHFKDSRENLPEQWKNTFQMACKEGQFDVVETRVLTRFGTKINLRL